MKLEKEAFFLRKRLDEINDARASTTALESKLLPSEAEVGPFSFFHILNNI